MFDMGTPQTWEGSAEVKVVGGEARTLDGTCKAFGTWVKEMVQLGLPFLTCIELRLIRIA